MNSDDLPNSDDRAAHWERTYQKADLPTFPSQFAVFACDYLETGQNIIEFGCGSGRDALFFATQGYRVFAYDASEAAIESCRQAAQNSFRVPPSFERLHIDGSWSNQNLEDNAQRILDRLQPGKPTLIYSRFFLHAITSEEQFSFLDLLRHLGQPSTLYLFEFRTLRDKGQSKVATPHYRRFINPVELVEAIDTRGFKIAYLIEGFGMAKYKSEDAHVARIVFQLSKP